MLGKNSATVSLFRDPAARPVARLLFTIASGAFCAALALVAAVVWANLAPYYYQTNTGAVRSVARVSDEMLTATLILGGWVWLILIWKTWTAVPAWRRVLTVAVVSALAWSLPPFVLTLSDIAKLDRGIQKVLAVSLFAAAGFITAVLCSHMIAVRTANPRLAKRLSTKVVATGGVVVAVCVSAFLTDRLMRANEEEFVIAALILIGAAAIVCLWLPLAYRGTAEPVESEGGEVNVICPRCRYSLVGLKELRCPECGERFTIDVLIRAQGYGKSAELSRSELPNP